MELIHIVLPKEDGMSLHQVLRNSMHLSGKQTRMVKANGAVTVDAAPFFSNQPVRTGMAIRVVLDAYDGDFQIVPGSVPSVEVVYEDECLLAVQKPALLQCHPSPSAPHGSDTLETRVHAYLGYPAHPVHRLDSETTGPVLFAKLPYVQAHLQEQMQKGTFCKVYEAWTYGCPSPESGEINAPIARENPDSFTRVVSSQGQPAISRYVVLERISHDNQQSFSRVRLSPVTGRTHQLRVHMSYIGCPLLGDTRYASDVSRRVSQNLGLTYHQLSEIRLSFIHPTSGKPIHLTHPAVFAFDPNTAFSR